MKQLRHSVIRAGLEALYFTGAHHLLRPIFAGIGAIFMLHHVRPGRGGEFQPNRHLEVTPEFLRATLSHLRAQGIDVITMDEVHRRLVERNFSRRFACFTLDDGYRDNRDFALPVLREFDAPFTVYVTSDFAEGTGRLWWIALEAVIARANSVEVEIGGAATRFDTDTPAAKQPRSIGCMTGCADCRASMILRARSACYARVTALTKPRSAGISACPGTN